MMQQFSTAEQLRNDAPSYGFFLRSLEKIETTVFEQQFPEYPFANGQLVPIDPETSPWAETITHRMVTRVGTWALISDYAQNLPRADVLTEEFTSPVRPYGASYGYSVDEILKAQYLNFPLETQRANTVRLGYNQLLNRIISVGDVRSGIPGLLTHPNVPIYLSAFALVAATSVDNILATMSSWVTNQMTTTLMIEKPNTLLLPVAKYQNIATRFVGTDLNRTILTAFKEANPGIEVIPVNELAGAGTGGTDVAVLYNRNPTKLQAKIPKPIEFLPPQTKGLGFEIPCWAKMGGVKIYYPLSVSIIEGI